MRMYLIISDLIEANDYLTLDYFTDKYQVSKRTIQNDLSYLIQIGSSKGYELKQFRGKGYLLEIQDKEKFLIFYQSLSKDEVLNVKERVSNILAWIAIQTNYVTLDSISNHFEISKTLLKKEIQNVENALNEYGLILEKKSHYGIRLKKDKIPYISLLRDLFIENNSVLVKDVKDTLGDFEVIYKTLINEFAKANVMINYAELKEVYVCMQIQAYCACKQKNIEVDYSGLLDDEIGRLIISLNEWVVKVYDVSICNEYLLELDKKIRKKVRIQIPEKEKNRNLTDDVELFLEEVDQNYGTHLKEDTQFKELLIKHVSLLIERFYQKISYKNSLTDEISIRYPRVFNMAISFSEMLKEKYGVDVSHGEAAFIATHFAAHFEKEKQLNIKRFNRIAVVCSSGGGSAFLIKMQIESLFPNENVESFSFLEMEKVQKFEPDIIFTIMPLTKEFSVPVIYIHELLDDEDLKKIKQLLEYDQVKTMSLLDLSSSVNTLFSKKFFEIGEASSYRELLDYMAKRLMDDGYGDEHYLSNVQLREEYMSTVYINGVAIPHPIEMCASKNVISTFIVKNQLMELNKPVRIVFMISLTKEDYQKHQDITKLLYMLMKDEQRLQRVLHSNSFEEMLIVLKEMEGIIR